MRARFSGVAAIEATTASPFPVMSESISVSQRRAWIVQAISSSAQTARAISTLNPLKVPSFRAKLSGG